MRVCWNAIVRNESARIERCMLSLIDHIDCAVIVDTGSSDDTVKKIKDFFAAHRKSVAIHHTPFENFSQARNDALDHAKRSALEFDYILLVDADMELAGAIPQVEGQAYNIMQDAQGCQYYNTRLIHRWSKALYVGVTHEYLEIRDEVQDIDRDVLHFIDHADGANRKDKFQRDAALLSNDLARDPNNARTWFYLAQSHRDAGEWEAALAAYEKRVSLGGWDEEVFMSQVNIANCHKNMGNSGQFVTSMLAAYNLRPKRAEPLYELAKHFREAGSPVVAGLFANEGLHINRPNDVLFVADDVYKVGLDEEMSVAGFYNPRTKATGFSSCDFVALGKHGNDQSRECARNNLFYYVPHAAKIMPSFTSKKIDWVGPDGWNALNPSIANIGDKLYAILRTVNYTINDKGQYDIDGKGSAISEDNPIVTKNILLALNDELAVEKAWDIFTPFADKYKCVRGWEDMRLFSRNGEMSISATVRESNGHGFCEQWYGELVPDESGVCEVINEYGLAGINTHEKNWMPIQGTDRWVYGLGITTDGYSTGFKEHTCPVEPKHLRGSSQVIPFGGNYLCVVHEALLTPDGNRFYIHRWVLLDCHMNVVVVSPPFVFEDTQIEFCAGLAMLHGKRQLALSYGIRDHEAHLATVAVSDVMAALTHAR